MAGIAVKFGGAEGAGLGGQSPGPRPCPQRREAPAVKKDQGDHQAPPTNYAPRCP